MYDVELSDEAISDYQSAVSWYEEQKSGLGFDFSVRLSDAFTDIGEQANALQPSGFCLETAASLL